MAYKQQQQRDARDMLVNMQADEFAGSGLGANSRMSPNRGRSPSSRGRFSPSGSMPMGGRGTLNHALAGRASR